MENNIIKHATGVAIINGGNPLTGCPTDWAEAEALINSFNEGKEEGEEPKWSFDCGFKLDFDGPLLRISSRFYPPKTHYGPTWDGTVTLYFLDEQISEKKFDCQSIEELRDQVESYVKGITANLKAALAKV